MKEEGNLLPQSWNNLKMEWGVKTKNFLYQIKVGFNNKQK